MINIFETHAPLYWAANLPAIPLRPNSKIPALNAWQSYSMAMPEEVQQQRWLEAYPDGNMGMPLGPCSGVIGLDVDNDDPRVLKILDEVLPPSPWVRIGKKGFVKAFKYNGERTTRIKDCDGGTILEILSRGSQIVLPPSIHPDTNQPYRSNSNLFEVIDQLNPLPPNFEATIRKALSDAGFELTARGATKVVEWTPAGGRDSAMIANAGLLARAVMRGERTLMEACNEIEAWVVGFTEPVAGDPMDPAKGRAKVVEFVAREVHEHKRLLPKDWDKGLTSKESREMRTLFGEECEVTTCEELVDKIMHQFAHVPSSDRMTRLKVIEDLISQIAKADNLNQLEISSLLSLIVEASGKLVKISDLKQRMKEIKEDMMHTKGLDHKEIAFALREEMEQYGELRYDAGKFWQWRGSHWDEVGLADFTQVIVDHFGSLPAAKKYNDYKQIVRLLQDLITKPLKEVEMPGVNFANGYLNMDLELLPHDPRYGCTYTIKHRYMPEQTGAPVRFLDLLGQCWADDEDFEDKVIMLQEAMAATMFGMAADLQRAILLYGVPNSGKSTIAKIMRGLMPPGAVCNVPPHEWGDKFAPAQMAGKLINFAGELSEDKMIPGSIFKEIVEGNEISGQYKGRDLFHFRPTCAQWFAGNHLPRTRDSSDGFNRRWLILQFRRRADPNQLVVNLDKEILAEEAEAIMVWAVSAIQRLWQRSEYTLAKSHERLIRDVAGSNNSVRFFLTSGEVDMKEDSKIDETTLHDRYYNFCKFTARVPAMSVKRFRSVMEEMQREFKFDIDMKVDPKGRESVFYLGLVVRRRI